MSIIFTYIAILVKLKPSRKYNLRLAYNFMSVQNLHNFNLTTVTIRHYWNFSENCLYKFLNMLFKYLEQKANSGNNLSIPLLTPDQKAEAKADEEQVSHLKRSF